MALSDIVTVTINRDSTAVSRQGFGTLCFLGKHKAFTEKVKAYSSLTEVANDGFLSTDPEYIAAQKYFGQTNRPPTLYIGRQHGDKVVVNIDTVSNSTVYSLVINGTTVSFTSDADATALEIAAGLVAAIDANGTINTIVDATDNLDGTFDIDPVVAGTDYTVTVPSASSSRLSILVTADDTLSQALTKVIAANNDWYALSCYSHLKADILALAADVEALKKIFLTSSSDSDILTGVTTDVASELKTAGYDRTALLHHDEADTSFPEAAWAGRCLGKDPGSITWKFKTLSGINAVSLSTTQETNAKGKNANVYTNVAGVNMTAEGKMASGEFMDVIRGLDWLESRMTEDVFRVLVNSDKVPYTDAGISTIASVVSSRLQDAVSKGVLSSSPAPRVTVPRAGDVLPADKAARVLNNVKFEATLAGAVHSVTITGNVAV